MIDMDWEERLAELDEMPEDTEEFETKAFEAGDCSDSWGCCSLAQRIMNFNPNWEKLTEDGRYEIVDNMPAEIYNLGSEFANNVINRDFEAARDTHCHIQNFDLDEKAINREIEAQLARMKL